MFPLLDFLQYADASLNCSPIDIEEFISFLIFYAEYPPEMLNDLESVSKQIYHILSKLYATDFCVNYLKLLSDCQKHKCVFVKSHNSSCVYKIQIRDSFMFEILLLSSLKYKKAILLADDDNSRNFLHDLVIWILQTISIKKPQSLQLLKLLEVFLNKREDILSSDISKSIVLVMNKVARSPLTGFKHSAHNISRIALKSLSQKDREVLCDFSNLPIEGIDLNDNLKLFKNDQIFRSFKLVNSQIMKLFNNNTDSRNGSFYYSALINVLTLEQFSVFIWPLYEQNLKYFQDDGEFYQSLLKYWIPINVKYYKHDFYLFIKNKKVDFRIKAFVLLETKKRGHYKINFDSDALIFLKFDNTRILGLKIICTYVKKSIYPDQREIDAMKYYLNHCLDLEFIPEELKYLKLFISQIFAISHNTRKKNHFNLDLYYRFLKFVYNFTISRLSSDNCELPCQLLKIIWDVATGSSLNLHTLYKIDRENVYESGQNLFYLHLKETKAWEKIFKNPTLILKLTHIVQQNIQYSKCTPNIIKLIIERYISDIDLNNFDSLHSALFHLNRSVSLQNSEQIIIYSDLIIAYNKEKSIYCQNDIFKLQEEFNKKINSLDIQDVFNCVLIFDIFKSLKQYFVNVDLNEMIVKSLNFFDDIFEHNLHLELDVKASKVLEALINKTLESLLCSKKSWFHLNKCQILNQLCTIIQKSNMKKPVSLSVTVLQQFGCLVESEEDKEIKIFLLFNTLQSLYNVPAKQNIKIRRNPETRLVLHALCFEEKTAEKPYLAWTLNFIVKVLSNPEALDTTLSSTLHCLEVLISDNSIHQFTLRFIPEVITYCINLFNRPSWIIRNADLQLLKSLIERFLGVSLSYCQRPKTIEDLFVLFPEVITIFYQTLSTPFLNDSAIIVLLFFSESKIKANPLINPLLERIFDGFRVLLMDIIKNISNSYGKLAIKAFAALCIDSNIPTVYNGLVRYILGNFRNMPKNIFGNLVRLLEELYVKYEQSVVKMDSEIMRAATKDLAVYLRNFDSFCFSLISLRLLGPEDAMGKITECLKGEIDYEKRLLLNTYLPFLFNEIEVNQLDIVLKTISSHTVPDFLQVKILSILIDRLDKNSEVLVSVLSTLILKLVRLKEYEDVYLITAYAKTILLFHDLSKKLNLTEYLLSNIRSDYQTTSIYKIAVYVMILTHLVNKSESDRVFLNDSVLNYIKIATEHNDDILCDISSTVRYLYKSIDLHNNNKLRLIKLIFYLLLQNSTSSEMCKLISFMFHSNCSSVLVSFDFILNFHNLYEYLGNEDLVIKLLLELYYYIDQLSEKCAESGTYYLIEDDLSIPKRFVLKIIRKSLFHFCSNKS